jgi:hypothetical protein
MRFKSTLKVLFSLLLLLFGVFLFAFVLRLWIISPDKVEGTFTAQAVGNVYNKKAYVLIYNPVFENGQKLTEYLGWQNPDTLVTQYINWLKTTTNNKVNFTVGIRREIADFTTFTDGRKYDEETYLACLSNPEANCMRDNWGGWLMTDYTLMLNSYEICNNFNSGTIDEVWMFGAPYMGWWEANQAGTNSFSTNGPVVYGTSCNKPMNIMGFSYERQLGEMVEDLFHRTEGTMSMAYGGWQENRMAHNWDKFGLVAYQSPNYGFSGCGSCHFAPNSTSGYNWDNPGSASTYCDEFADYPDPINPTIRRNVTCSEWDCNGLGYFTWWYERFPSKSGVAPDNHYADWWKYVLEPNSVYDVLTYVPPSVTPAPTLSPTTVAVTNTAVPRTGTPAPTSRTVTKTPTPVITNPANYTPVPITVVPITITDNVNGNWEIVDQSEPAISGQIEIGTDNTSGGLDNINGSSKVVLSVALFGLSGLSLAMGTLILLKFIKPPRI